MIQTGYEVYFAILWNAYVSEWACELCELEMASISSRTFTCMLIYPSYDPWSLPMLSVVNDWRVCESLEILLEYVYWVIINASMNNHMKFRGKKNVYDVKPVF